MKKLRNLIIIVTATALLASCAEKTNNPQSGKIDADSFVTTTTAKDIYIEVDTDTKIAIDGETVVDVVSGSKHILVLTKEGNVYGEGDNSHGQLATGDFEDRSNLVKIEFPEKIKLISNCAAVGESNTVYHWSASYYPTEKREEHQNFPANPNIWFSSKIHSISFNKEITDINKSWDFINILTSDGEVYTYGAYYKYDTMTDTPENKAYTDIYPTDAFKKVDIGEKAVKISSGEAHTIVLGESGSVYGYGSSYQGQLSKEELDTSKVYKFDFDFKCKDITANSFSSFVLSEQGEVYTSGYSSGEKENIKLNIENINELQADPLSNNVYAVSKSGEIYSGFITPSQNTLSKTETLTISGIYKDGNAYYITADAKNALHEKSELVYPSDESFTK